MNATMTRARAALLAAGLALLAACAPPPGGPGLALFTPPHAPPRLTLSNFSLDHARIVVAVVAAGAPCSVRGPGVVAASNLPLPFKASHVVYPPPGTDVCWYRDLAGEPGVTDKALSGIYWNRADLSRGRSIDARI